MGKKRAAATGEISAADQTISITSPLDLKTLIHEHSLFFDQLVELIPARFFLPYSDDKPWFPGLSKSEKNKFKAQTRENIIKSRRDRLDPTRPASSTLDLLKKSLDEEKELHSDEEVEEEEEKEEEEEDEEEEKEVEKAQSKPLLTDERPVTYEELQERLRRRIAELSAGRNTRPGARLKQERKKDTKNKKKIKVQTKKNREKNKEKEDDESASAGGTSKRKREDGKDETFSKNKKKNKAGEPTDITFGQVRIDGKENKKRKKKLSKEKELERAKRLEEVKKDPEKGKKVSWKAAVSKAAGEKVHDDPKLLKQSIKREKKKQQKNAQKWREREETVSKAKAEKQSKRAGNIKERIHQKKMRKIEKREKKLMRPGFEGRKDGYINK